MERKIFLANLQGSALLSTPKYCHKALKNIGLGSGIQDPRSGIRDPRSGIRDPGSELQDPGSGKKLFRIQGSKGTGSRIRICNTMSFYESFIHCNCMRGGDHYSQRPVMSLLKKHLQNSIINSIENCNCRPLVYIYLSFRMFPKLFTHR